jgi:hypothetical protein
MKSFEILVSGALKELDKLYDNKLDDNSSQNWLERHAKLYQKRMEYLLRGGNCNSFSKIYSELNHLRTYLVFIGDCESKLLDFYQEESKPGMILIEWLIRNEEFGLKLELFNVNTCFQYPEKVVDGYLPLIADPAIWIKYSDYSPIVNFLKLFSQNYFEITERFAIEQAGDENTKDRKLYYGPIVKSLKEYVKQRKDII